VTSIDFGNFGLPANAENVAPKIVSVANLKAISEEKYLYQVKAIDLNGDALAYELVLKPEGMGIAENGTVYWKPGLVQVGSHRVVVRVSDNKGGIDLQTFDVIVQQGNSAPIITSVLPVQKPQVGKEFQYRVTAQDLDGDTLSYSLFSNPYQPIGVSIDPQTGVLKWTPTAAQLGGVSVYGDFKELVAPWQVIVKVTDGKGGEAYQSLDLIVDAVKVNAAPVINSVPRKTMQLGSTYYYAIDATDPNGDWLTYSLVNPPAGMTIKDGLISWTPTAAQSGNNNVTLKVSDGSLTTTQSFELLVTNLAPNYNPVITSVPTGTGQTSGSEPQITSIPTQVANLDRPYVYNLKGVDADGDLVVWTLEQAPEGMVIDVRTGALRWQPQENQIGERTVAVKMIDSLGAYAVQEFVLQVKGVNTPPSIVSTPPTKAGIGQSYTYLVEATDPEADVLRYMLAKHPQGMKINGVTGQISWTPIAGQVGRQDIEVQVMDAQGAVASQIYRIEVGSVAVNLAPTISSQPIFSADAGKKYQYQVVAKDPENGALTYSLAKAPVGMVIDAVTGLITWNSPTGGDTQVIVKVVDSSGLGVGQGYTLTTKQNHAPVINSTPLTKVVVGNSYRYDVVAQDIDGDALTYAIDDVSNGLGVVIDKLGRVSWKPSAANVGNHPVTVEVKDSLGAVVTQVFNLEVLADNAAPTINLIRGTNIADIGDTVTFQVQATDNVGISNRQLLVNDQAVALDANGVGTYVVTAAGVVNVRAIVTDVNGNVTNSSTTVNVVDPTDVEAPIVSVNFPTDNITGITDIIGSINDPNLDYYVLEVAPVGTEDYKEVFRGTSAVTNGVLGKFDPTNLVNDTYTLRLSAFDTTGHGTVVEREVAVTGELKLGNFRLSFTDIAVPVTGIPITLTRTYDTLASKLQDEFGYGWRMEFRDTDLRTSLKKDDTYEQLGYRTVGFSRGDRVYITLPGGKREGFTFSPVQLGVNDKSVLATYINGIFGGNIFKPTFVADKTNTTTLTVDGSTFNGLGDTWLLEVNGKPGKFVTMGGLLYRPDEQIFGNQYTVTTKDGMKYKINATDGKLESIKDTNGNTLNYTDTEIRSSNGQKVVFERDNQGRIVSVTDPLGAKVKYEYDAKGDLVAVIDRDGNTTKYEYNSTQQHYLDKIIDPLGREAVKTEYDAQSRLKKTTNAGGNGVEFIYDPENSIQVVKDALGNATTYEYDARGNVVTEVDAVGKLTKSTYDDDNNMLSETVISDRSGSNGFTTTYTYDGQRNRLSETDALGNTTYYTYGAKGRLLTTTDPLGRTTTNSYDGRGNVLSTKDSIGNITNFVYDDSGQVAKTTDAQGNITQFEYDSNGHIAKIVDALGYATSYTYNSKGDKLTETKSLTVGNETQISVTKYVYDNEGRMTSTIDPLGHTTKYEYNKLGKQIAVIDALGRKTQYIYDEQAKLVETIYADDTPDDLTDNSRTRIEYDLDGREVATIDKAGRISRTVYDAVGRVVESIAPDTTPIDLTDNPRTKTEYYGDGLVKASIDELGHRTEYRYDSLGRQIETIFADATPNDLTDNPRMFTQYNQAGQQISTTDALNHTTRYFYDSLGRVVKVVFADDTFTSTTYDSLGRKLTVTDQNSKVTEYRYDSVGQLIGVRNALGDWTNYVYNLEGSQRSITDANGNVTSYEYDLLGRRTATILPLNQRSKTSYDVIGNISSTIDFNGKTTTYKYDVENRLIEQKFTNDPTVRMTYTVNDLVATITGGRGVTSFSYDAQDRLASRIDPDGSRISYTYDLAGNRTSVTTQVFNGSANTTGYTFDERNRLDKVLSGGVVLTDYDYNAVNNLIKTTLSNGVVETRQYDKLHHLLNLRSAKGNNLLTSFAYTLDKVGNRQKVVETVGSNTRNVSYTYDDLYRLTKEQAVDAVNGNRTTAFVYDKVGNRMQQAVVANNATVTTTYQYDANDRLLKEKVNGIDKVIYTYDNNGNTLTKTEDGKTTQSIWDDRDRLIGAVIKDSAGVVNQRVGYEYDSSGIRVTQTVGGEIIKYLIDANLPYAQVLVEYRPSGLILVSYTHGNDLINQTHDGESSFYHVDGLGSTKALSDNRGSLIDTYNYQAFGELLNSTGTNENKYLFAGEQFDAILSDYYNRARYYDPATGRFTKRDNYEGQLHNPITLHKYFYANENPIDFIDPSGLTSMSDISAANSIFNQLISISNMTSKVLNVIDKVNGVVEAVNFVSGILNIINGGGIQQYLEGFVLGAATNPNFSISDAFHSLSIQLPNIMRLAFPYWLPWLVQYNKKVSEVLLYPG
jgi:RHS repeat-associated protein